MKKLKILALLTTCILLLSCDDEDTEKFFINLDKESLILDMSGEGRGGYVKITCNDKWKITNIPEWLEVGVEEGDSSQTVYIGALEENNSTEKKEASLVFSCGTVSKTLLVEQLSILESDPFVKFDQKNLSMSVFDDLKTVKLISNAEWEIANIPEWLHINPKSGKGSAVISIKVYENQERNSKRVQLEVVGKEIKTTTLAVEQVGRIEIVDFPEIYNLFSFSKVTISNTEISAQSKNIFVNPFIKDKVYLGNLISHNAISNTDIPQFTGYTFNPITVSTDAVIPNVIKTYMPILAEQNAFATEIITQKPMRNKAFKYDNEGKEFYTYKKLNQIGILNLGIKLDELVSGKSHTEYDMQKKCGMVFSFKQILFSLDIDIPAKLIKEDMEETDRSKGVSYVSLVEYGKVGFLIVESDDTYNLIQNTMKKVFTNATLEQTDIALIQAADISYVYFDNNNKVQVKKGNMDAIEEFEKAKKDKVSNIYPVGFEVSDFDKHSSNLISF